MKGRVHLKICFAAWLLLLLSSVSENIGQTRRPATNQRNAVSAKDPLVGKTAIVMDELLSVLRREPSLFSEAVHRMQRGRQVSILGTREADGVTFLKVKALPSSEGWVQSEAVISAARPQDEERGAMIVQALAGFEQVEAGVQYFKLFPNSRFRPTLLLIFGDTLEDIATNITRDAGRRLRRKEMAASAAPMHSYYLNFVMLDRYRKLGIRFLFNPKTRNYHYDGQAWSEIVSKFPDSTEAAAARERLNDLKTKLEAEK
ncbi:MAG: SH3 domain-containing protein [Acidobacteriota bacterium]|nr:MAG: SH3 domain-containing protein [Acidobacteriota bacterium]